MYIVREATSEDRQVIETIVAASVNYANEQQAEIAAALRAPGAPSTTVLRTRWASEQEATTLLRNMLTPGEYKRLLVVVDTSVEDKVIVAIASTNALLKEVLANFYLVRAFRGSIDIGRERPAVRAYVAVKAHVEDIHPDLKFQWHDPNCRMRRLIREVDNF